MSQIMNDEKFVCFKNGALVSYSFAEAHQKLWAANLQWVVPIRWYMWKLDKYEDDFYFKDMEIGKAAEDFAFALHTKRCSPVTEADIFLPEGNHKNARNALTARASRFGHKAFHHLGTDYDKMVPFEPVDIPTCRSKRRYGYQMKRSVTWFVVVEREGVPEHAALDFDWTLFLNPPARDA